jgi:2-oxoglutarate/2-oxoacid ferredoxin oxidoreductase subunit beta
MSSEKAVPKKFSIKDYKADSPRWCSGCGDFSVLVGMRKHMMDAQLDPANVVHVSGIGCSGRLPHYFNTYGIHGVHGRAIPIALGVVLARPDLNVFIESGDGDALSIGGNHLIHGINKNFNCVFVLLDNQIYGLTKSQSSPTTQTGFRTPSQPEGTFMGPINPIQVALGLGGSFVASTADWLSGHFLETMNAAAAHPGFSFVHVAQRCPKYNPEAWDYKSSSWYSFLNHENGVAPDQKFGPDATIVDHDPSDRSKAFEYAQRVPRCFGVFYKDDTTTCYAKVLQDKKNKGEQPTDLFAKVRL